MDVSLIVAVSENGVIGKDNQLLWQLPSDMKRFRRLTMGKPIVMGRKTFQSIGKPLPGRDNIIITRDKGFKASGAFVVHSLEDALALGQDRAKELGVDEVMVIGGSEIYELALPLANTIYYTKVHTTIEGDAFFPKLDQKVWSEQSIETVVASGRHDFDYDYIVYRLSSSE